MKARSPTSRTAAATGRTKPYRTRTGNFPEDAEFAEALATVIQKRKLTGAASTAEGSPSTRIS